MARLILIIDDDTYIHSIVKTTFEDFAHVLNANEGDAGFRLAKKYRPDIILLDITMPGLNGYEVCERLKFDEDTKHIPVIFISGNADVLSKIKGYDVGADDFIVKPFDTDELLARIQVMYQYVDASRTAKYALGDTSDMGRLVRLVGRSYDVKSTDELAATLREFFSYLSLHCHFVFWLDHEQFYFEGDVNQSELKLTIRENRDSGRIIDHALQTQVNYPKVSLLVTNMPIDDDALYGRFKDMLTYVLEVADSKLESLEQFQSELALAERIHQDSAMLQSHCQNLLESVGELQQQADSPLVHQHIEMVAELYNQSSTLLTLLQNQLEADKSKGDDVELF